MKKINLFINKFGPLKDIELEFAPFMLFTGESGLGKSYANYLIYYFISTFTEGRLVYFLKNKMDDNALEQTIKFSEDEIRRWINSQATPFMQEFFGDKRMECDVNFQFSTGIEEGKFELNYKIRTHEFVIDDESHKEELIEITVNGEESKNPLWFGKDYLVTRELQRVLMQALFGKMIGRTIIMPPARGAFTNSDFSAKQVVATHSGMYELFLQDNDRGSKTLRFGKEEDAFFANRIKELIGGELINEKEGQFLQMNNGSKISLQSAASSIKEIGPFLNYVKNWGGVNLAVCLEEPEAHLHPKMQVAFADLLAACFNKNSWFQMTSHSDYFLQRINQLIKLGEIRKKDENAFKELGKELGLNNRFYLEKEAIKLYYFYFDAKEQKVKVEDIPITAEGFAYASFFDVVKNLQEREAYINDKMEELNLRTEA